MFSRPNVRFKFLYLQARQNFVLTASIPRVQTEASRNEVAFSPRSTMFEVRVHCI